MGWAGSYMFYVAKGFSLRQLVRAECVRMSKGAPSVMMSTMRHLYQVSSRFGDVSGVSILRTQSEHT